MIKFAKTLQLRDQTDCLQSCFGKVLGGAIMKFKLKDPGSAITHGIAFLLAAVGAAPLLIRSSYSYCGTGSVYSYDDAALCGKYSLSFR